MRVAPRGICQSYPGPIMRAAVAGRNRPMIMSRIAICGSPGQKPIPAPALHLALSLECRLKRDNPGRPEAYKTASGPHRAK